MSGVLNKSSRIGLVAIVTLWLVWLVPQFMGDYRLYKKIEQPGTEPSSVPIPISQVVDTKPIILADLYLMGKPETPAIEPIKKFEELEETRLDLRLRGVFASQGPLLGGAVIDTGSKEPGFFQIGDLIAENITLAGLEGQAVIIDRNGKREKLSFDKSIVEFAGFQRTKNNKFVPLPEEPQHLTVTLAQKSSTPVQAQQSLADRLSILRKK